MKCIHSIRHNHPLINAIVTSVVITPDSQTCFTASRDRTIKQWNLSTGELMQTINVHKEYHDGATCLAISPDGQTLVCGGPEKIIMLWDLKSGESLGNFEMDRYYIKQYYIKRELKMELTSIESLGNFDLMNRYNGTDVIGIDSEILLLYGEGYVSVWDLPTKKQIYQLEIYELDMYPQHDTFFAITPDRKLFITEKDKWINLYDLKTGKLIRKIRSVDIWISGTMTISNDSKIFAYSYHKKNGIKQPIIELLQLSNGELLRTFCGHTGYIYALIFSPDGKLLFSGSKDSTIKKWCVNTGELLETYAEHSGAVCDIAISPDGKTFVSVGGDCLVKIWQL